MRHPDRTSGAPPRAGRRLAAIAIAGVMALSMGGCEDNDEDMVDVDSGPTEEQDGPGVPGDDEGDRVAD